VDTNEGLATNAHIRVDGHWRRVYRIDDHSDNVAHWWERLSTTIDLDAHHPREIDSGGPP